MTINTSRLGELVLNALVASRAMGHASLADSAIYFGDSNETEAQLLVDILRECKSNTAATKRLNTFLSTTEGSDVKKKIASAVMR